MDRLEESKIYSDHENFVDRIITKKRFEITKIIDEFLKNKNCKDVLDIGTTENNFHKSSNIIIKNIKRFKTYKSISDQKIQSDFFKFKLKKSITDEFSEEEIQRFKSDFVISNATIEHVGDLKNQIKMCKNIINLSKRYFAIITPNRFHPIEFHTRLPFFHWLPKKIHRQIIFFIGYKFLSLEKNLNLLSIKDLHFIMREINHKNFEIKHIKLYFFKSNLILLGKII